MKKPLDLIAEILSPFAAMVLALLVVSSCQEDSDSQASYSLTTAELVEAHANQEKKIDYVITDEGVHLTLSEQKAYKWAVTADSVYRAVLYYDKLDAGRAKPIALGIIGTAAILSPERFSDGVKTDPVSFESAWVSTTRRYLNVSLYLKVGTDDDTESATQSLGVVGDTLMVNPDQTRTWHLRLHHDQGGVPQYYSQHTYFSLPLTGLEADSISLSVQTYDGLVKKSFKL